MASPVSTLWTRFESAMVSAQDDPGERRKKIALVVIAVLSTLTAMIYSVRIFINEGTPLSFFMPTSYALVVGTAIVIFFSTRKFNYLLYPFLVMILVIPFLFHAFAGGFSSQSSMSIVIWAVFSPVSSMMFQSKRAAVRWFIIYLALTIVVVALDARFMTFLTLEPYSRILVNNYINLVMLSLTLFITLTYFVNALQREQDKSNRLIVQLQESNSDLERTLTELRATQAELVHSEKMAGLGKLAAGIAHEINNPIGALKSSAATATQAIDQLDQLVVEDDRFAAAREVKRFNKLLDILRKNGSVFMDVSERIATTVGGFIQFARLDSAEREAVNLNDNLRTTIDLVRSELRPGVAVNTDLGELPDVDCYPGELNQVFLNLLTNAAHAVETEGTITVSSSSDGEFIRIEVSDTGVGIEPDRLPSLFNPEFSRTGKRVKAGLGLFTVYNIVQKHKGRVSVDSEVGKGSTFTVQIPVVVDA